MKNSNEIKKTRGEENMESKQERNYEPAELLSKQMELLAKESESADSKTLVELSNAMANLYMTLNNY